MSQSKTNIVHIITQSHPVFARFMSWNTAVDLRLLLSSNTRAILINFSTETDKFNTRLIIKRFKLGKKCQRSLECQSLLASIHAFGKFECKVRIRSLHENQLPLRIEWKIYAFNSKITQCKTLR